MWISTAYAQSAGASSGYSDMITNLFPLVLIFVVFYFLLIRPQQSKLKEQKSMLSQIRRGDRIVTGGGLIGTVARVLPDEEQVEVDLAENVRVRVLRSTISSVLSKPTPVGGTVKSSDKPTVAEAPASGFGGLLGRFFKR